MSDEGIEILASILSGIISIAIMYGLYVWLGFELAVLVYLASMSLKLNKINNK